MAQNRTFIGGFHKHPQNINSLIAVNLYIFKQILSKSIEFYEFQETKTQTKTQPSFEARI